MNTFAMFAGGCFWCVEHDFRGLIGVAKVESGYASDVVTGKVPSYENHTGFREAVRVEYDTSQLSFKKLVQFFLDHIDPTDGGGQFFDRGETYQTAIFVRGQVEREIAESLLDELRSSGVYDKPVSVLVLPLAEFFLAEEYHQNYAEKNPDHYERYRNGSGRAEFVAKTCAVREEKHIMWKT